MIVIEFIANHVAHGLVRYMLTYPHERRIAYYCERCQAMTSECL